MPVGYQRKLNSLTEVNRGIVTNHEIRPLPSRFDDSVNACVQIVTNAIRVGRFDSAIVAINELRDEVSETPIHRLPIDERDQVHVGDSRVGLSIRTANTLVVAGVHTLAQLSRMTAADIIAIQNCGEQTINEIRRAILRVYPEARFRKVR